MTDLEPGDVATALLDSVPDLVYIVGLDGRILWWNDRLPELTGYDEATLSEMVAFDLLPEDQRAAAVEALSQAGTYEPSRTMEFDVLTSDGERVPHEFNGAVLEVDGRTVVATIARDVTDRREREREIRRQRDELETLHNINETVSGVVQDVVDAASREEIERDVCQRLAASERYEAVWIARNEPDGSVDPVTGVGTIEDFVGTIAELNEIEWTRPAQVAVETGEVQVVQGVEDADLPERVLEVAERLGIESGTSVPIVHRGTVDGVISVYSSRPDAFSAREQAAFERLGEIVGFAISAVRTERLLLSETATELTFRLAGRAAFLATVSQEADGTSRKAWSTPVEGEEGRFRHYVTVEGLDPGRVLEIGEATPTVASIEHVGDNGEAHVFAVVTTESFTRQLLEAGATPTATVAEDGETTVVAELPGDADVRPVVEAARELYDAELVSKRELQRPVRTTDEFLDAVADRITDRQREALRHAYFGGYFSWPRDATAEEVAERMEVTSPTFHYHIRRAERALVEAFLQHLDD